MVNPGSAEPGRAGGPAPPDGGERKPHFEAGDLYFRAVFESAPDAYLLVAQDAPHFR